ncbi:MAG: AAA family ATPase [Bacillota bacterium]|nr:AAA family ATPase [Bacillota bacterium]
MSKDKDKELTKEELMKRVLGKKRSIDSILVENAHDITRRLDELKTRQTHDESHDLLRTLMQNQEAMNELSQEVDLSDLKASIARDFGVQDTLYTEKTKYAEPASSFALEKMAEWKEISPQDVPKTFHSLFGKISESVIGQEGAVRDMVEGLLRPYVQNNSDSKLRNTVYISGRRGSGRHYLFERSLQCIRGLLIDDVDVFKLDMADYQEAAKENVFLQDIYSALCGKNPFILIENYEFAHISINNMLGDLIKTGKIRLSKRYIEKNGVLQESDKTLQKDFLKEISGNDKFLIFIASGGKSSFANTYGKSVADAVLDYVETESFSPELASKLVKIRLGHLKTELESVTKAKVNIATGVMEALSANYEPFNGVHSFIDTIEDLKLKVLDASVSRIGQDLTLVYDGGYKAKYLDGIISLSETDEELLKIKREIGEIVGLDAVKEYLLSMENLVKAGNVRRRLGLKSDAVTRHMIFTGNPGTGKTTIARLVSRLMKAIGALDQGHLVEVTRADLVGRYVGHTAPLTMSVIKSALGGVLFIDEAYSLYRGKDDSFGLEAIDTLVKGMEDNRDNLMVILAGYSDEMSYFLTSNSGLASRFPKTVHFADYEAEDLLKIAQSVAKKKDYVIADEALEPIRDYLGKMNAAEKSNGRLARNVVEAAIIKQSGRISSDSEKSDLRTLLLEDFDLGNL